MIEKYLQVVFKKNISLGSNRAPVSKIPPIFKSKEGPVSAKRNEEGASWCDLSGLLNIAMFLIPEGTREMRFESVCDTNTEDKFVQTNEG